LREQVSGFRKFILRGNVVDLAIAVVIGAAFGAVVAALVKDLITPIIGAFGGVPDFSALARCMARDVKRRVKFQAASRTGSRASAWSWCRATSSWTSAVRNGAGSWLVSASKSVQLGCSRRR
jgi:hypothetical protein